VTCRRHKRVLARATKDTGCERNDNQQLYPAPGAIARLSYHPIHLSSVGDLQENILDNAREGDIDHHPDESELGEV
jgi:hypothetical protein